MKLSEKYLVHAAALLLCTVATLVGGPQPLEKTVAPAPPPPEIDWAGPYVGLNVGVDWTHYDFSRYSTDVDLEEQFYEAVQTTGEFTNIATFPVTNHNESHPDVIGGGQLGYNFQFGHFVAGVEGGFSAAPSDAWKRSEQFQINPVNFFGTIQLGQISAETSFNSRRHAETNWNGYVGGQLGYAWWRLLFYGNVGAAFTDLQITALDRAHTDFFEEGCAVGTCPGAPSQPVDNGGLFLGGVTNTTHRSHDDVLTGFYGGGGIQYALNEMIRVGLEYRHCDFGDQTFSFHSAGPVFSGRTNFDLHSDQLTFRVNIMLGRLWPFHR
jgi:opacity protein-like surface antigen